MRLKAVAGVGWSAFVALVLAACNSANSRPPSTGCQTCLDCKGQAYVNGECGGCTNSSQCCAPLICYKGSCFHSLQ
jgi:hypothetical protein